MKYGESKLQQACVRWFRYQYPSKIIFAIPNGGRRSKIEASIMNGEGVLKGVCDLFVMEPRNGWHGLFIEMKFGKNSLSDHQKLFIDQAAMRQYKTAICYTFESFTTTVDNYLES